MTVIDLLWSLRYNRTMSRIWYSKDTGRDSPDAVHQTFALGTLDEVLLLKKTLGEGKLKELFLRYPKKIYTSSAFNFVKKFILNVKGPVDEKKYLKFTPRSIG